MNTTGLTTILIEEKEIKLRFGLPACQAFYLMCLDEESEKYVNGMKLTGLGIAKLLYAAHENATLIEDRKPEVTPGGMLEYVELTILESPKELERVIQVFSDSKYTNKLAERATEINEVIEAEKKKPSTGTILNRFASSNSGLLKSNSMGAPSESSNSEKKGTNAQKAKKKRVKK